MKNETSDKKYEILSDGSIVSHCSFIPVKVFRIRALKSFGNVKKGDLGGFVEGYHNLSQDGNCWIYDGSICCNNAKVSDNAKLKGFSTMIDDSALTDNAVVDKHSILTHSSIVCNNANVKNHSLITFNAIVEGDCVINKCSISSNGVVGGFVELHNVSVCDMKILNHKDVQGIKLKRFV